MTQDFTSQILKYALNLLVLLTVAAHLLNPHVTMTLEYPHSYVSRIGLVSAADIASPAPGQLAER